MMSLYDPITAKSISVDIGDCRVDFLGGSDLLGLKPIIGEGWMHLHTMLEVQFAYSNDLKVTIQTDQGILVPEGSLILIPANELHSTRAQGGSRMVFNMALHRLPAGDEKKDFSEYRYYSGLLGQIREPTILNSSILALCLTQLLELPDTPANSHQRIILLEFFFIQLCKQAKLGGNPENSQFSDVPGGRYNQEYFLIEHFVNTHYHLKTTIDDIAGILHVSRRQADRIVEQVFGKSYAALVTDRRMSIAETLLKKTNLSCTQIAESVGFSSYPGFFLAFRQYFGVSPYELRSAGEKDPPENP